MGDLVFAVVVDAAKGNAQLSQTERQLEAIHNVLQKIGNDDRARIRLFDEDEIRRHAAMFFAIIQRMQREVYSLNDALRQATGSMRLLMSGGGGGVAGLLGPGGGGPGGFPLLGAGGPSLPVAYRGGMAAYRAGRSHWPGTTVTVHPTPAPMAVGGGGIPPLLPPGGHPAGGGWGWPRMPGFNPWAPLNAMAGGVAGMWQFGGAALGGLGAIGRGVGGVLSPIGRAIGGPFRAASGLTAGLMGFGLGHFLYDSMNTYEQTHLQGLDVGARSGAGNINAFTRMIMRNRGALHIPEAMGLADVYAGASGRGMSGGTLGLASRLRFSTGVSESVLGQFMGTEARLGTKDQDMRRLAGFIADAHAKNPGKLTEILGAVETMTDMSARGGGIGGGLAGAGAAFGIISLMQKAVPGRAPGDAVNTVQRLQSAIEQNMPAVYTSAQSMMKGLGLGGFKPEEYYLFEAMAKSGSTGMGVPPELAGRLKPLLDKGIPPMLASQFYGAYQSLGKKGVRSTAKNFGQVASTELGLMGFDEAERAGLLRLPEVKKLLSNPTFDLGLLKAAVGAAQANISGLGQSKGGSPEGLRIRFAEQALTDLKEKVGGPISNVVRDIQKDLAKWLIDVKTPMDALKKLPDEIAKLGKLEQALIALGLSGGNPVLFGAMYGGMRLMSNSAEAAGKAKAWFGKHKASEFKGPDVAMWERLEGMGDMGLAIAWMMNLGNMREKYNAPSAKNQFRLPGMKDGPGVLQTPAGQSAEPEIPGGPGHYTPSGDPVNRDGTINLDHRNAPNRPPDPRAGDRDRINAAPVNVTIVYNGPGTRASLAHFADAVAERIQDIQLGMHGYVPGTATG